MIRTSSGRGAAAASANSFSYCCICAGSISTSAGFKAGAATNSKDGLLKDRDDKPLVRSVLTRHNLPDQLPCEPEERLLEVVVGLGRDFKVLQVLLSVEGNTRSLDLSLLDIDLVTAQHDGDVFTDSLQVSVPVGNVLVGDSRCNVEHDDTTLT